MYDYIQDVAESRVSDEKIMGLTDKVSREGSKSPSGSDCKGLSDTRSSAGPQGFAIE